jgi:hypothetical protein
VLHAQVMERAVRAVSDPAGDAELSHHAAILLLTAARRVPVGRWPPQLAVQAIYALSGAFDPAAEAHPAAASAAAAATDPAAAAALDALVLMMKNEPSLYTAAADALPLVVDCAASTMLRSSQASKQMENDSAVAAEQVENDAAVAFLAVGDDRVQHVGAADFAVTATTSGDMNATASTPPLVASIAALLAMVDDAESAKAAAGAAAPAEVDHHATQPGPPGRVGGAAMGTVSLPVPLLRALLPHARAPEMALVAVPPLAALDPLFAIMLHARGSAVTAALDCLRQQEGRCDLRLALALRAMHAVALLGTAASLDAVRLGARLDAVAAAAFAVSTGPGPNMCEVDTGSDDESPVAASDRKIDEAERAFAARGTGLVGRLVALVEDWEQASVVVPPLFFFFFFFFFFF